MVIKALEALEDKKPQEIDERLRLATREIFASTLGRFWLNWLLDVSGIHASPFSTDTNSTMYNCGAQQVGRLVDSLLRENSSTLYTKMIEEKLMEDRQDGRGSRSGDRSDSRSGHRSE